MSRKDKIIKGTTQAYLPDGSERYILEEWDGKRWVPLDGTYDSKREADRAGELANPGRHRK